MLAEKKIYKPMLPLDNMRESFEFTCLSCGKITLLSTISIIQIPKVIRASKLKEGYQKYQEGLIEEF